MRYINVGQGNHKLGIETYCSSLQSLEFLPPLIGLVDQNRLTTSGM